MRFRIITFLLMTSLLSYGQREGKTFRDCATCPELVAVPAGQFLIGSPLSEAGRSANEGPQQLVHIKAFAIGKNIVTRGEWKEFVESTHRPVAGGCAWSGLEGGKPWALNPSASWKHLGFPQDDSHPAVCLSYQDVQEYLQWLSKKTKHAYRLPSESEWEYAARAGTQTTFPWGDTLDHEHANYGADSGWTGIAKGRDKWGATSPVGSFPANHFGLFDMPGNVMQFTGDCYAASYANLPGDGSSLKTDSCNAVIIRGGDWGDPPFMLRVAFRNWAPAKGTTLENYRSAGLGFRVVRELK